MELWENVTDGSVYVPTTDARGRDRSTKFVGRAKARISTEDRENLQAVNPGKNPFENGRLRRIDAQASPEHRLAAFSDEDLLQVVDFDQDDFLEWTLTESELNVRRLRTLMRRNRVGDLVQHEAINGVITDRWPNMTYTREQLNLQAAERKYDSEGLG